MRNTLLGDTMKIMALLLAMLALFASIATVKAQTIPGGKASVLVTFSTIKADSSTSVRVDESGAVSVSVYCGLAVESYTLALSSSSTIKIQCTGSGIGLDFTGEGNPEVLLQKD